MKALLVFILGTLIPLHGFPATLREDAPRSTTVEVPILIFHSVRPYLPSDTGEARQYIATPGTLERELGWLKANGYASISFDDLARALQGGAPLPPKPVIISFDDGWESQFTYAVPLLEKYGFRATFFVYTNAIGVKNYMTWEQLRSLEDAGMQIGCHSKSHWYLTRIRDGTTLRREISGARQVLEQHLGRPVTTFAYPFGQYNEHVVELVREAGFTSARGTLPGVLHTQAELFTLTGIIQTEDAARVAADLSGFPSRA
jgi:peptidoglycan/xylan/chitin deacetylase (PgdA/CDA1 family)